jgi:hypothetical protein
MIRRLLRSSSKQGQRVHTIHFSSELDEMWEDDTIDDVMNFSRDGRRSG